MRLFNGTIKSLLVIVSLLGLTSCSSASIDDYQATTPKLVLADFFNGKLTAAGIVQDFSGKVTRTFTVTMQASWQGNQGVIDEDFIFNDGEKQKRIWQITRQAPGQYTGTANDILGTATGVSAGNALQWRYEMILNVDGTDYQVSFDDWMFLVDDNTIINKSDIIKFGVKVASVTLVINKQA
ncbi:DUF3833 domain-containing protein [Shewanella marina]|uniref:DUF3833 domain-containing protein n=1 Tax=Shewanella marina TaxID=487319 RepID=UPI00047229C5|nr:DUF3833 domain-containing protein [Shewanella marina]